MNGIIIVDKPQEWTSHDVVGKIRRLSGEKRVGHSGTLDPMATGVLPIFIGRATRAVQFLENVDKQYIAGIRFGIETDTQDIWGNIISQQECSVTIEDIERILPKFRGEIQQLPPMYSALKVNGKKLYELARAGKEVERQPRTVIISSLDVKIENGEFFLQADVSKGTYIRTLCHDIGKELGCGAVMTSLRRTRVGTYIADKAYSMDQLIDASDRGIFSSLLSPTDSIFEEYPIIYISGNDLKKCLNGNDFQTDMPDGKYRVYSTEGSFLAYGQAEKGQLKTIKSFFEV